MHTIALSAAEMNFDEIVLVCSGTGFVSENISICTEPAPSDVLEVQGSAVAGVADFRADTTNLSTFDHTSDTVTTDAASRTASQADVSSLATQASVNTIDTEVGQIKAKTDQLTFTVANQVDSNALTGGGGDDAATIYSYFTTSSRQDTFKATGFSTHAPTDIVSAGPITTLSGAVVNVDTVDTVTDKAGYSLSQAFPANFADLAITATTGRVDVENNNDKTGYTLTQTFPSNFADLIIGTGADLGKVTTSNPASGGGSAHTAQDVADLILVTPANKLATNATGQVEASNASDATAANQTTIIGHLTDVKGTGWVAADNLAEIAEDVAGLNGDGVLDATATAAAVWNATSSTYNQANSTGRALKQAKEGIVSADGSVNDASPTATTFISNLTNSNSSFYHDKVIVFVSGNLSGQARHVESYNGTTKEITVSEAFTLTPANGDDFLILATHEHSIDEIQAGLATSSEVLTRSTFDPAVDAVANVTTVGSVTGSVGSVTTPVTTDAASRTASQADLTSITSDVADVKSVVDSILLDTGTDGVVISTAQAQALADEVLSRSVASVESGAAEHTLATIVLSILESQRTATNWTIYKSDGTTSHVVKDIATDQNALPVTRVN